MKKALIRLFQLFILLVIRLRFRRRVEVRVLGELRPSRPVVIVSNHANRLDPFIIACFLPVRAIFRVFPYAFMTANVYYYRWWRPVGWLAGCFPARPRHDGENPAQSGINRAIALLDKGYCLVMFPEGRRTRQRIEARPGVSRILEKVPSSVILCHISWPADRRGRIILSVKPAGDSLNIKSADAVMDAAYALSARPHLD